MARILVTSGPTRQHLDPVRYLTNASSGRMGSGLAAAGCARGHEIVVVSGPVDVIYPAQAQVISVVSTEEMLEACQDVFPSCQGMIGVAAPCDYRPVHVEPQKIQKTGRPLELHLIETPDIVATLGHSKHGRWIVGFALETQDHRLRALAKLQRKCCDLVVVNGEQAMRSERNSVEIIEPSGSVVARFEGLKDIIANDIFQVIDERLIQRK